MTLFCLTIVFEAPHTAIIVSFPYANIFMLINCDNHLLVLFWI